MLFKDFIPDLRTWDLTLTWSNVLRLVSDLINRLDTWQGPDLMTSGPTWTSFHEFSLDLDLLQGLNTWCGLDLETQNLTLTWLDVSRIHLDLILSQKNMFSCRSRCAGRLQRDHLRLRTDVLWEDTHHGGERTSDSVLLLLSIDR